MKKFRFVLLALGVAAGTFAFTPSSSKQDTAITLYAFSPSGTLLGSAPDTATIKDTHCPGANMQVCAQVWTSKTADNQPAGTHYATIKKP